MKPGTLRSECYNIVLVYTGSTELRVLNFATNFYAELIVADVGSCV